MAEYNLVADAVREAYQTEIEMENLGGVRSPLVRGPITVGDLIDVDPFTNTVVTFKISGRDLKQILKRFRPAVSGVRYRLNEGELTELTVGGEPVDEARIYTGATNSYFAPRALKDIPYTDTGKPRLQVLMDYVKAKGKIAPALDGRRVVMDSSRN